MASERFRKPDRRFFSALIMDSLTHPGIDRLEQAIDLPENEYVSMPGETKERRAVALVNAIFENAHTDDLIIDLLDFLCVEDTGADYRMAGEPYRKLEDKVLVPRGVMLKEDGFEYTTPEQAATAAARTSPPSLNDIWDSYITTPPKATPVTSSTTPPKQSPVATPAKEPPQDRGTRSSLDPQKVFIVHGRDDRPVKVIEKFLTFIGLRAMAWSEAVAATGKAQPTTFEIVSAGLKTAAAVIVIFSPDDLARIKDDFSDANDEDRKVRGQARQNVTLEAGMAFGLAPDRTIFVRSAYIRPISDIDGFNWVKLDGEWESRNDLMKRLEAAGARVNQSYPNLLHHTAGEFTVTGLTQ
ncbi:TIR domain-containing protein [Humibacter ginsengisoli]